MWQNWLKTWLWQNISSTMSAVFVKLLSMQIVDIQCRPIIYSTYVQRLSVHTYTPTVYTLQYSPPTPQSRWTTTWCIPPVFQNRIQFNLFHPFSMKISLLSAVPLFHHGERMAGATWRWEERAWKWTGDSSRKLSWVLPWPEVKDTKLSGKGIM